MLLRLSRVTPCWQKRVAKLADSSSEFLQDFLLAEKVVARRIVSSKFLQNSELASGLFTLWEVGMLFDNNSRYQRMRSGVCVQYIYIYIYILR